MEEEDDMHMCLVCHRTINGLLNYVNHKKSECTGRKSAKVLSDSVFPGVSGVTDLRNQSFGLGTNASYISQSYSSNGQQVFSSGDSFQRTDPVHVLNPQTGISSTLDHDVFDTAQFQSPTTDAEAQLQDICLKGYSLQTSQNASVTHTLFDSQASMTNQQSSCDLAAFGLSPSIFTSASTNLSKSTSGVHDHGLLNACISNGVEPDFGSAVNIHIPSSFPILSSDKSPNPNAAVININEIIPDNHSKSEATNKTASEKVDDFFQSLELMSKSNVKTGKGSSFSQPLLPISNILNDLTFSSDEEDLGFNFADDVSLDSMSDESDDSMAPPSDYTGAKWKPGEKPGPGSYKKSRQVSAGKWPPGQVPEQTTAKYYGAAPKYYGRPKGGKGGKNISSLLASRPRKTKAQKPSKSASTSSKKFHCNFCDVSFQCRYKYSNHCGSVAHKEKVFGKRDDDFKIDLSYGKGEGKSVVIKKEYSENEELNEVPNEKSDAAEELEESQELESRSSEITEEHLSEKGAEYEEIEEAFPNENVDETRDEEAFPNENVDETRDEEALPNENVDETRNEKAMPNEDGDEYETRDEEAEATTDVSQFYTAVPLQIHICTVCDKKFPNKYYISNHLLTKYHRNRAMAQRETDFTLLERYHKYIVRLSPFQCSICRFYFNKAKHFESHLKSKAHNANCEDLIGELTCSLCQYKTHNHSELLDHITSPIHKRNTSKLKKVCIVKESHVKCSCKYCGLEFKSFTRLKRHILHKHADKQPVAAVKRRQIGVKNRPECPDCVRKFQSESALQLHIRRFHTGEKPYRCEPCDASFAGRHALTIHYKTAKHLQRILASDNVKTKTVHVAEHKKGTEQGVSDFKNGSEAVITVAASTQTKENTDRSKTQNETRRAETVDEISGEKPEFVCKDEEEEDYVMVDDEYMDEDTDVGDVEIENDEEEWKPSRKTGRKSKKTFKLKNFLSLPKVKKDKKEKVQKRKRRKKGEVPVKIHKCDHCDFTAKSYNDLRPHYMKEHSTQIKICELCDLIYLSEKGFKLHVLSKEHQQNINRTGSNVAQVYYTCHICKKKFTDEKYCKFHTVYQHFHLTSEEAVLTEYGKDVTREKYEKILDETKDLDQSASVTCPECQKVFKKNNFLEHLRTHSGDKPFKCKMCTKAFMSSVTLRRHLLGHFGCQERTCEVCGKHFKKIPSFEDHMKLHVAQSGDAGPVHTCEVCGQAFYFERQLQFHLRRHRAREFACTYPGCHWKFVYATELKYHMHSHTNYKPFLCDICGYATVSKCRLKRHHRTHTGERNYHCEYCTYKAGNSTHLHRHMRIHIGSKPFKCPHCDYSCNTHENMRKHIVNTKKHKGLFIYPCKFCKFGTNSCNDFRKHLVETHEDEVGPNFHMAALSSFTGLFQKSEDLKEPEEGNKIYQVRERVHHDPKTKKQKKRKHSNKDEDVEENFSSLIDKSESINNVSETNTAMNDASETNTAMSVVSETNTAMNDASETNKAMNDASETNKAKGRRKSGSARSKDKAETSEVFPYHWTILRDEMLPPRTTKPDNSYTVKPPLSSDEDLLKPQISNVSGSFFSPTSDQIRLHNLEQVPQNLSTNQLVPLSQYKPQNLQQLQCEGIPTSVQLKSEYPPTLVAGLDLSQMHAQFHPDGTVDNKFSINQAMKPGDSPEKRASGMMYHGFNCSNKFGSGNERDSAGNLVIDMHFSHG